MLIFKGFKSQNCIVLSGSLQFDYDFGVCSCIRGGFEVGKTLRSGGAGKLLI